MESDALLLPNAARAAKQMSGSASLCRPQRRISRFCCGLRACKARREDECREVHLHRVRLRRGAPRGAREGEAHRVEGPEDVPGERRRTLGRELKRPDLEKSTDVKIYTLLKFP